LTLLENPILYPAADVIHISINVTVYMMQVSATCERKLHGSDSAGSLSAVGAGGAERQNHVHSQLPRDSSVETIGDTNIQSNMAAIAHISAEQCGLPLLLFTQVCHFAFL
jgi:hypothetical protein